MGKSTVVCILECPGHHTTSSCASHSTLWHHWYQSEDYTSHPSPNQTAILMRPLSLLVEHRSSFEQPVTQDLYTSSHVMTDISNQSLNTLIDPACGLASPSALQPTLSSCGHFGASKYPSLLRGKIHQLKNRSIA